MLLVWLGSLHQFAPLKADPGARFDKGVIIERPDEPDQEVAA